MKKKNYSIIDKSDIMTCWACGGNNPKCRECQGTNKYRESHYIIVDEVNKIAIDSDTIS